MGDTKNPVGSRSPETRDRLIDAAIVCVAKYGYSGATMRMIADLAGVTQGPRQYYFPTTIKLYEAVVDKIHGIAEQNAAEFVRSVADAPISDKIRALAEPAFLHCGNDNHLCMLELKLACRGNPDLREAILEKVLSYEERTDQFWVELLKGSELSEQQLVIIRQVFASSLRGWGLAVATGEGKHQNMEIGEVVIEMLISRFGAPSDEGE